MRRRICAKRGKENADCQRVALSILLYPLDDDSCWLAHPAQHPIIMRVVSRWNGVAPGSPRWKRLLDQRIGWAAGNNGWGG